MIKLTDRAVYALTHSPVNRPRPFLSFLFPFSFPFVYLCLLPLPSVWNSESGSFLFVFLQQYEMFDTPIPGARAFVGAQFRKFQSVSDLKVIDMLRYKGEVEFHEVLCLQKSKCHLRQMMEVKAPVPTSARLPADLPPTQFLEGFYNNRPVSSSV